MLRFSPMTLPISALQRVHILLGSTCSCHDLSLHDSPSSHRHPRSSKEVHGFWRRGSAVSLISRRKVDVFEQFSMPSAFSNYFDSAILFGCIYFMRCGIRHLSRSAMFHNLVYCCIRTTSDPQYPTYIRRTWSFIRLLFFPSPDGLPRVIYQKR